jgi:diguanylate cyclase (GGDEF)-like protein
MADIEHFKQFNDTYGHLAGYEALRHVTRTLEEGLRKNDFAGRFGGEEFILFFYNTDEKTGLKVLERLRKKLASSPVMLESSSVPVYASFGVAGSFTEDPGEKDYVQRLISNADTALYAAKRAGRNRVMLYSPEQEQRLVCEIPAIEEPPGTTPEMVDQLLPTENWFEN